MKLHAYKEHPDYHDIVHFAKCVKIDGTEVAHCVATDTDLGLATVVTQPIKVVDGEIATHDVRGAVEIEWTNTETPLFTHFYNDWCEREKLRKQEQHAI